MTKAGTGAIGSVPSILDTNWHSVITTYGSSGEYDILIDGLEYASGTNDLTFTDSLGLRLGAAHDGSGPFFGYIAEVLTTSNALDATHRSLLASYWANKYNLPTTARNTVVCDGNSMTAGLAGDDSYPSLLQATLGNQWSVRNLGVSGQTTSNMLQDITTTVFLYKDLYALRNVVVCWEGGNSIKKGSTATMAYDDITNYCTQVTTNGQLAIVMTIPKRSDFDAAMEASRQAVNTNIVTNWNTFAAGLVDLAANDNLDYDIHPENFHVDLEHPNTAGNTIIQSMAAAAILALP